MNKPAIAIVSEVVGEYRDRCADGGGFFSTELAHQVLNALVAAGYCVVSAPTPADAQAHPSCWVAEPDRRELMKAWHDAVAVYRENRDIVQRDGYVAKGAAGGVIKSPHYSIMRDVAHTMAKLGAALDISPITSSG